MKKKKKKKKITFDLDADLNETGSNDDATEDTVDKENQEPESAAIEDDGTMDLENFGKKKKKKKKVFNFDELEATLPDTKKEVRNSVSGNHLCAFTNVVCTCHILYYPISFVPC